MKIQLIRHATLLLEYDKKRILVDPMLNMMGTLKPVSTVKRSKGRMNPTVELPMEKEDMVKIIDSLDAILLTHLHFDHFSEADTIKIPKSILIICQQADEEKLKSLGFTNLLPVEFVSDFSNIQIKRTKCNHGGVVLRHIMGSGSGFILRSDNEPTIYIAGDTVYCRHVEEGLDENPDITIVNAGGARLSFGRSITMNAKDIRKVCEYNKKTQVIAVHMEAVNHCLLTRKELKEYLEAHKLAVRVSIPKDGQVFEMDKVLF